MSDMTHLETWLIDLDGVMWLGDHPIAGSREAILALRANGRRVAFFTNNSFSTRAEMLDRFRAHGVEVADNELLSSSQSAAQLCEPGSSAAVLGGAGIEEALTLRGIQLLPLEGGEIPDAVVVGLDRDLNFSRLTAACRAINAGARFLATNDDATYPTNEGTLPGGGALVAAIAYATRVPPEVAGKPHPGAVALSRALLGAVDTVVGDRPETDGELARGLGARYGLVRSGVTGEHDEVEPRPDADASDLADLVAVALGWDRTRVLSVADLHS